MTQVIFSHQPSNITLRIEAKLKEIYSGRSILIAFAFGLLPPAHAADIGNGWKFDFSGFGTLGIMQIDRPASEGTYAYLQTQIEGVTNSPSFANASLLGAQGTFRRDDFSITTQLVSRRGPDNQSTPRVDWMFAKWTATPELSFRVGRIVAPIFATSQSRNIGYANIWTQAPTSIYGSAALNNMDGADVSYSFAALDGIWRVQAGMGTFDLERPANVVREFRGAKTLVLEYEYSNWTARMSYADADTTLRIAGLEPQLAPAVVSRRLTHPELYSFASDFLHVNRPQTYASESLQYDDGVWSGLLEVTQGRVRGGQISRNGWILGGGYRLTDMWQPYVFYSVAEPAAPASMTFYNSSGASPFLFNVNQAPAVKNLALGVRYEVMKNMDLKAQLDNFQVTNGMPVLTCPCSAPQPSSFNMLSVSLDFVF
jgi:hypothetical protein